MEARNLPRIEAPLGVDRDNDDLKQFAKSAVDLAESHLATNRQEAKARGFSVDETMDEVLANHNTRSLDIRARPLENPKVTLWLKDCPAWANDAWTETFHPWNINRFNGKVTVTIDVRPF